MARPKFPNRERPWPYIILCGFLGLVFLTGGGSRPDIQSLVLLRPVAVLVVTYGLWGLRRGHIRDFQFVLGMMTAIFLLVSAHLVPLPPSIWSHLPGRDLLVEVDRLAGLGSVWRPISMVPSATWNAFYSLFVPLAVLLLAVQITREQRFQLLLVFIVVGLASGLLGMLQVVGTPGGVLYLYNVTNSESAVGLFSNRNHQAILLACLFPMLAVYASSAIRTVEQHRTRSWIALVAGAVIIPLLLVTGSRAGLILGLLGIGSVPMLYRKPLLDRPAKRKNTKKITLYLAAGFFVIGLGTLTFLFSRAQAFERIIAPDQAEDIRLSIWAPIADMAWKYFPFGSGIGSFVEVYQIDEPLRLLVPSYLNHAHNDWLELYMTGGLPALLLTGITLVAWVRASAIAWRSPLFRQRDVLYSRLGSIILLILAGGSIGDYPLRAPILACFAVVAALWTNGRAPQEIKRGKNGGTLEHARLAP